jgi:nucleotide-binding universal stress UspA family protein
MYDKLLVGYDGSGGARAALSHAVALAQIMGAEVWALWVRETIPYFAETVSEIAAEEEAAHLYLGKLKAEVERLKQEKGFEIHLHSQAGHAAEKIVRYAIEGAFDLIVLGSHGHSGLWGRLLGHTTDRVSEHAPCSVLIVRAEGRATEPSWSEEIPQ